MAITYTPTTNFGAKDSLPTNDPDKVIKGSEFTTEFTALQTAFSLAAPNASPTFTGTVTIPTADINGGTIDGVTIGGSSAGAITGTTGQFNTSLNVDGTVTADGLTVDGDGLFKALAANATPLKVFSGNSATNSTTTIEIGDYTGGGVFETPRASLVASRDGASAGGVLTVTTGNTSAGTLTNRLNIASNGDISFYEDTGTTAKFFWDASEEALGIGTSSVTAKLDILGSQAINGFDVGAILREGLTNTSSSYLVLGDQQGVALRGVHTGTFGRKALAFYTSNNTDSGDFDPEERMRIDSSGRVGIGTSSPSESLETNGNIQMKYAGINTDPSGARYLIFNNTDTTLVADQPLGGLSWVTNDASATAGEAAYIKAYAANNTGASELRFGTGTQNGAAEAMRLDASGNFLVGTTAIIGTTDTTGSGHDFRATGAVLHKRDGSTVQYLNRLTSDGDILDFRKDGTTVGSIGTTTDNSRFCILDGSNRGFAVRTADGETALEPSTTSAQNGYGSLGTSGARWKDLYLSGTAYVEGSGSAAQMVRGFATNASYTGQVIQSLASRNTTNESYEFLRCSVNGVADRLKIYDNGNVENTNNSYGSLSDIKLKENVVDASAQWDDIKGLRFRKYNFKEETGQSTHTQMGLIAQEAELVCPGIVKETTDRDQEGNDLGTTTKSIQYSLVYVKAVKALQEAMARIETLEAEVAALKGA